METLKLEHIAPYLPYELQFKDPETVAPGVMVSIVSGMPGLLFYEDTDNIEYFDLSKIKPLLIPLSEVRNNKPLLREIAEWLYSQEGENFKSLSAAEWWIISSVICCDMPNTPYKVVEKFIEKHIDVFGLIDRGLAIDINALAKAIGKDNQ